jgi:hypothetical protein
MPPYSKKDILLTTIMKHSYIKLIEISKYDLETRIAM